jgi:hypothetical protein
MKNKIPHFRNSSKYNKKKLVEWGKTDTPSTPIHDRKYQFYSHWFDLTVDRINDIPPSRRARFTITQAVMNWLVCDAKLSSISDLFMALPNYIN